MTKRIEDALKAAVRVSGRLAQERDILAAENDRLWRYLTDEVGIVTLPEWMRDRIVERIRAEEEGE